MCAVCVCIYLSLSLYIYIEREMACAYTWGKDDFRVVSYRVPQVLHSFQRSHLVGCVCFALRSQ